VQEQQQDTVNSRRLRRSKKWLNQEVENLQN